jgi:hypothetical protein
LWVGTTGAAAVVAVAPEGGKVGLCRPGGDKGEEMAEGGSRETAKEDVGVVATAATGDCCTLHALLGEAGSMNKGPPFKERRWASS